MSCEFHFRPTTFGRIPLLAIYRTGPKKWWSGDRSGPRKNFESGAGPTKLKFVPTPGPNPCPDIVFFRKNVLACPVILTSKMVKMT